MITELGGNATERLHLHGLIWCTKDQVNDIDAIWKYGTTFIGEYVNEKTIGYIIKYMLKTDEKHIYYKPKVFVSKGIGAGYIESTRSNRNIFKGRETNTKYKMSDGREVSLPTYYRNKLWTPEEKEYLRILQLEKKEKWIGGTRYDISTRQGQDKY